MPKVQKHSTLEVEILEGNAKEAKKAKVQVSRCPECHNRVFFLEAGFLCPTCGYSTETVYS